jgi:fructokinase
MTTASELPALSMDALQFGIDLGGTKTEIIVLDDRGQTLYRHRVPTPAQSYIEILNTIEALVIEAQTKTGLATALGVGAPGAPIPRSGRMKNANTTCLIGQRLEGDLSQRLGMAVLVENDANCLALSEAVDGAGAGARTVFAAILGTGVGGGISIGSQVIRGRHHIGGEWGHNPMPFRHPDAQPQSAPRRCYCARWDCIETYLSGPGLARTYGEMTHPHAPDSAQRAIHSANDIAVLAKAGDQDALKAIKRYADQLAIALASVINVLDPDTVVLGGGVSNIDVLYPLLSERLGQHVFTDELTTPVKRALHGDSSGVRGAAWLASQAKRTGLWAD